MIRNALVAAAVLASVASAQVAYLVDSDQDRLYTCDLNTGAVTFVASTLNNNLSTPAGLAWRDDTAELYTIDLAGGEVGTIDVANGTFTPVFQTSLSGWQGIAWDPAGQVFYLANQNDNTYVLDPATGTTTLLGNSGFGLITAMDIDASGTVWGIDFTTGAIVRVDKVTGVGTQVATTITNIQGLAIDAAGRWFGINTTTDSLYSIDPVSGTATLIGQNIGTQFVKGFEIADSAISNYGTACRDGNGDLRRMQVTGSSQIGTQLFIAMEQGSVQAGGALLFGYSSTQFGAFSLPLDLTPFGAPSCFLLNSADAPLGPIVTGIPLPLPVPNAPNLVGFVLYIQGVIADQSPNRNALGIALTDGARIVFTN
ncbi:MAG: hypothetical protein IPM29_25155 [Planctomycetes bacterium]|nr:hypothetical protein [Planctomycetota bacterium]